MTCRVSSLLPPDHFLSVSIGRQNLHFKLKMGSSLRLCGSAIRNRISPKLVGMFTVDLLFTHVAVDYFLFLDQLWGWSHSLLDLIPIAKHLVNASYRVAYLLKGVNITVSLSCVIWAWPHADMFPAWFSRGLVQYLFQFLGNFILSPVFLITCI